MILIDVRWIQITFSIYSNLLALLTKKNPRLEPMNLGVEIPIWTPPPQRRQKVQGAVQVQLQLQAQLQVQQGQSAAVTGLICPRLDRSQG